MNITEIRKLSDKEVTKALSEKQAAVKQFRFDITGGRTKNMRTGGNAKKAVARLMTELRARQSATEN